MKMFGDSCSTYEILACMANKDLTQDCKVRQEGFCTQCTTFWRINRLSRHLPLDKPTNMDEK